MRTVDCAACGARFAVPDEVFSRAVAGRQRRMVCKRCGAHVVVDGTCVTGVEAPWVVAFGADDDRELTTRQLREAIATERVQGSTLVWRDGMEDWVALRTVEEFASAFGPRPAAGSAPEPELPAPDRTPDAVPATDGGDGDGDGDDDGDGGESGAEAPTDASPRARTPSSIPAPRVVALPRPRPGLRAPGKPAPRGAPGERAGEAPGAAPTGAMHALFAVESIPPVAELSDAEVLSLPPSRPARGPSPPVIIPRAARLPKDPARAPVPGVAPLADATLDVEVTDEADPLYGIDVTLDEAPGPGPVADGAASGDTGRGVRGFRPGWLALGAAAGLALVAGGLLLRSQRGGASDAARPAGEPRSAAPLPSLAAPGDADSREPGAVSTAPEPRDEEAAAAPPADATQILRASDGARPAVSAPRRDGPDGAKAPPASVPAAGATDRDRRDAPASGRSATATATATEPGGGPFDRAAAASALTTAAAAASSCRRGADPSGTATVTVTFAPSGRVTSVNVAGPPFAGTATGGCIATTLRRASVPPFAGSHVTVSKRIVVQ